MIVREPKLKLFVNKLEIVGKDKRLNTNVHRPVRHIISTPRLSLIFKTVKLLFEDLLQVLVKSYYEIIRTYQELSGTMETI